MSLLNHNSTTNAQLMTATSIASELLPLYTETTTLMKKESKKRRIRLAYVSGDFSEHPVAYFLEGVLDSHDRSKYEVYLISAVAREDKRTTAFKEKADHWLPITNKSDLDAINIIKAEAIDIAIDLSGWTRGNRLALFRNRIAPIQMTWIGYSGSTGVRNMDYIICDANVLPFKNEKYFSETAVRMPHAYLSLKSPHTLLPPLPKRPYPKPGRIIFGSFNTLAKLNPEVIEAYVQILKETQGSILILRTQQFNDDSVKTHVAKKFQFSGIPTSRIILEGNNTRKGMLAAYRKIDIALDPFPYGGTTTTFEALCMSVPVITLKGDTWVNRVGASLLKTIGYEHLIASSKEDYIKKAVALTKDLVLLKDLRLNIGERMHNSYLCNTSQFTQDLEAEIAKVWHMRY